MKMRYFLANALFAVFSVCGQDKFSLIKRQIPFQPHDDFFSQPNIIYPREEAQRNPNILNPNSQDEEERFFATRNQNLQNTGPNLFNPPPTTQASPLQELQARQQKMFQQEIADKGLRDQQFRTLGLGPPLSQPQLPQSPRLLPQPSFFSDSQPLSRQESITSNANTIPAGDPESFVAYDNEHVSYSYANVRKYRSTDEQLRQPRDNVPSFSLSRYYEKKAPSYRNRGRSSVRGNWGFVPTTELYESRDNYGFRPLKDSYGEDPRSPHRAEPSKNWIYENESKTFKIPIGRIVSQYGQAGKEGKEGEKFLVFPHEERKKYLVTTVRYDDFPRKQLVSVAKKTVQFVTEMGEEAEPMKMYEEGVSKELLNAAKKTIEFKVRPNTIIQQVPESATESQQQQLIASTKKTVEYAQSTTSSNQEIPVNEDTLAMLLSALGIDGNNITIPGSKRSSKLSQDITLNDNFARWNFKDNETSNSMRNVTLEGTSTSQLQTAGTVTASVVQLLGRVTQSNKETTTTRPLKKKTRNSDKILKERAKSSLIYRTPPGKKVALMKKRDDKSKVVDSSASNSDMVSSTDKNDDFLPYLPPEPKTIKRWLIPGVPEPVENARLPLASAILQLIRKRSVTALESQTVTL